MDRYVSGEPIDTDLLLRDLELAVARASLYPVVPADATSGSVASVRLDSASASDEDRGRCATWHRRCPPRRRAAT